MACDRFRPYLILFCVTLGSFLMRHFTGATFSLVATVIQWSFSSNVVLPNWNSLYQLWAVQTCPRSSLTNFESFAGKMSPVLDNNCNISVYDNISVEVLPQCQESLLSDQTFCCHLEQVWPEGTKWFLVLWHCTPCCKYFCCDFTRFCSSKNLTC